MAVLLAVVEVVHMFLVPSLMTFVDADIQRRSACSLDESKRPVVWESILEPDDAPQGHVFNSGVSPLLADPRQTEQGERRRRHVGGRP